MPSMQHNLFTQGVIVNGLEIVNRLERHYKSCNTGPFNDTVLFITLHLPLLAGDLYRRILQISVRLR